MTTLRPSEINPAPDVHADGFVETADGFSIRYALFQTGRRPARGSIVLLQGRNETIEKYFETIADLTGDGFDVVTFDWRGQGGSTRFFERWQSGYVESFDQYAVDLETVFAEVVLPDARPPYFLVAHSMGALVALYCAPAMTNRIQRIVLAAPLLGLPLPPIQEAVLRIGANALSYLGLGNVYMSGGTPDQMRRPFEQNRLTSDARRYSRNMSITIRNPDLALGGPSARWSAAVFDAVDVVTDPEHMAQTTIPTLIFMAGDDHIVSNPAILSLAENLRSASLLTVPGARHELFQEADHLRRQVFAALEAFVPGTGQWQQAAVNG